LRIEVATSVAAEADLRRVSQARHGVLQASLSNPDYETKKEGKIRFKLVPLDQSVFRSVGCA